jgi:lipopolysaccharide export system protein LptC
VAANNSRTLLDRLVAWSPVLLLGSLAALTYWLDAQVQQQNPRRDGTQRHDPDLFIENFRASSFDIDGRLRQSLAAKRAEHYPDDDGVSFVAPALAVTDPGKPRMAVTADKGQVSGDRETVSFTGNVRATRDAMPATPAAPATKKAKGRPAEDATGPVTVTTEFLRVVPKQGKATTDKAVTIAEPRGIIEGVGMELDNQAKTLTIKSSVRGSLQPQPPAK